MADTLTWTDPQGTTTLLGDGTQQLTGARTRVLWGRLGDFMPTFRLIEDEAVGLAGSILRHVALRPRNVDVPLQVQAGSESAVRDALRALFASLSPLRGDGRLDVLSAGAVDRYLVCRYAQGFEGLETNEHAGLFWRTAVLTFHAPDPAWYASPGAASIVMANTATKFFPFFPLVLNPSTIASGEVTMLNPGDLDAWPVWTVTGPVTTLTLVNVTTGSTLVLAPSLLLGQSLTIDTRPGRKLVTRSDGTNLFATLSATSRLFGLVPGENVVTATITAAGVTSKLEVTYVPRYLSC